MASANDDTSSADTSNSNYSSDGEDDASANSSFSSFIGRKKVRLSSWSFIYQSVINLLQSGEQIEIATILDSGKQAASNNDPVSALKLISLGLTKVLEQHCSIENSKSSNKNEDRKAFSSPKEITRNICQAFVQCSQAASISFLKQHGKDLSEALHMIIESCDALEIMDIDLLSSAAALCFSLKDHQKALTLASRATKLDPTSVSAQEVYENMCCHVLERWHFVMLNDEMRNKSYREALWSVLETFDNGTTVCDVGCGTGLLSLIAAEQTNCSKVFAIEKSSVMCDVARDVLRANLDLETFAKVKIINKMSSNMSVPEDLPHRVDILVTETFDAGLFGEGILPTLCHAWSQLLKNESTDKKGLVIPGRAQLYVQPVESDYILNESRLHCQVCNLDLSNIYISSVVGKCEAEPYTTLDLKNIPGGFRPLSEPLRFMSVDFNDPEKLAELNRGVTQEMTVSLSQSGRLDALIMWFRLNLTDSVDISTHTDCNSCWEQAVFPVCPWKLKPGVGDDLNVKTSNVLKIAYLVKGGKLCLTVTDITEKETHTQQFDKLMPVMTENCIQRFYREPLDWCAQGVYCLNGWEVASLNDNGYQLVICDRLKELQILPGHEHIENYFLHLNNGFSPICLKALQLGYNLAFTLANNSTHESLLERLCHQNKLNSKTLRMVEDVSGFLELITEMKESKTTAKRKISNLLMSSLEKEETMISSENSSLTKFEEGRERNLRTEFSRNTPGGSAALPTVSGPREFLTPSVKTKFIHDQSPMPVFEGVNNSSNDNFVVVCDIVDFQGRIVENLSDHLAVIEYCLSEFESKTVVPHCFDVYGILVDSEALSKLSRVQSDRNTLGYNIGRFVNEFSTRNHQGIVLDTLPHSKLTQPFKMFSVSLNSLLGTSEPVPVPFHDLETDQEICGDGDAMDKDVTNLLKQKAAQKRQLNKQDNKMTSGIPETLDASVLVTGEANTSVKKRKQSVTNSAETESNPCFSATKQSLQTKIVSDLQPEVPLELGQAAHPRSLEPESFNPTDVDNKQAPDAVLSQDHSWPSKDFSSCFTSNNSHSQPHFPDSCSGFSDIKKFTSVFPSSLHGDKTQSTSKADSDSLFTSDSSSYINLPSNSGVTAYDNSSITSSKIFFKDISLPQESKSSQIPWHSISLSKDNESYQQYADPLKEQLTAVTPNVQHTTNLVHGLHSSIIQQGEYATWVGYAQHDSTNQNLHLKTLSQSEQYAAGDDSEGKYRKNDSKFQQTAVESREPGQTKNLESAEESNLDQTRHLEVPVIRSGNVTALVYWFDLHMSPTAHINTLDPNHHWQQAAVMTHTSKHVTQGDFLNLQCILSNSAISFLIKDTKCVDLSVPAGNKFM